MKKTRKIYSKEFKRKAVELGKVRGNVQGIARELGVRAELIYLWRRELETIPSLAFGDNGKSSLRKSKKSWQG